MQSVAYLDNYLKQFVSDEVISKMSPETLSFASAIDVVSKTSPEIADAIVSELRDQRNSLKLIASENYAEVETILAMGNWLTDKYAEGSIPLHTLRADIDYGFAEAKTTAGIIGIKVWVYKGEVDMRTRLGRSRGAAAQQSAAALI